MFHASSTDGRTTSETDNILDVFQRLTSSDLSHVPSFLSSMNDSEREGKAIENMVDDLLEESTRSTSSNNLTEALTTTTLNRTAFTDLSATYGLGNTCNFLENTNGRTLSGTATGMRVTRDSSLSEGSVFGPHGQMDCCTPTTPSASRTSPSLGAMGDYLREQPFAAQSAPMDAHKCNTGPFSIEARQSLHAQAMQLQGDARRDAPLPPAPLSPSFIGAALPTLHPHSEQTLSPSFLLPNQTCAQQPPTTNVPRSDAMEEFISVVDPQRRKLRVPYSAILPTKALCGRNATPSLCLLFQAGRCRQGSNCYQVHISPTVVETLRATTEQQPMCCAFHGDVNSEMWNHAAYASHVLTVSDVTIPMSRLAYTVGLERVLRDGSTASMGAGVLCRMHGIGDSCRFGSDCKFLHVCHELVRGRLSPALAMANVQLPIHPRTRHERGNGFADGNSVLVSNRSSGVSLVDDSSFGSAASFGSIMSSHSASHCSGSINNFDASAIARGIQQSPSVSALDNPLQILPSPSLQSAMFRRQGQLTEVPQLAQRNGRGLHEDPMHNIGAGPRPLLSPLSMTPTRNDDGVFQSDAKPQQQEAYLQQKNPDGTVSWVRVLLITDPNSQQQQQQHPQQQQLPLQAQNTTGNPLPLPRHAQQQQNQPTNQKARQPASTSSDFINQWRASSHESVGNQNSTNGLLYRNFH